MYMVHQITSRKYVLCVKASFQLWTCRFNECLPYPNYVSAETNPTNQCTNNVRNKLISITKSLATTDFALLL